MKQTGNWLLVLALPAILLGCASHPAKDTRENGDSNTYGNLYDGDERIAHEAGAPADVTVQDLILRGDQSFRNGEIDDALFEYVKALEIGGKDADLLNKIGGIHTLKGNLPLAEDSYRMSIAIDPENAVSHEGLGIVLLRGHNNHKEASEHLSKAVSLDQTRWRSLNGLGLVEDLKGNSAQAHEYYNKALEIAPKSPQVHNNIGYSYYMISNWDEALKHFKLALNYEPRFDRAWQNIGLVYARQGNYDAALTSFQRVMGKPEAYNNIGYSCMMNGEYNDASVFLQKAIDESPAYYPKAHNNLDKVRKLKNNSG